MGKSRVTHMNDSLTQWNSEAGIFQGTVRLYTYVISTLQTFLYAYYSEIATRNIGTEVIWNNILEIFFEMFNEIFNKNTTWQCIFDLIYFFYLYSLGLFLNLHQNWEHTEYIARRSVTSAKAIITDHIAAGMPDIP
jgi:hypothetical protein